MNNIKHNIIAVLAPLLVVSLSASVVVAIDWPIKPHNSARSLSGTYGDVRGSAHTFHMAVDIPAGDGKDVYCVKGGYVIATGGDWIQIGDTKTSTKGWSYTHMDNIPAYLVKDAKVLLYALVGKVRPFTKDCDHLDFRLDSKDSKKAFENPVEKLSSSPPQGNTPVVSKILFRKQEEGDWFTTKVGGKVVIYDSVDVIAKAYNHMGSIPSQFSQYSPGVYIIQYEVTGSQNIPACSLTTFTGTLTKADGYKIYDKDKTVGFTGKEEFYYTVTNTDYKTDQHWYTRSKSAGTSGYKNGVGGGLAKVNSEAHFKDGKYFVKVKGYGWHGDTGDRSDSVIVDNFKPYVKMVKVKQGRECCPKYECFWPDVPLSNESLKDSIVARNDSVKAGQLTIELTFSEVMDTSDAAKHPGLEIRYTKKNETKAITTPGKWEDSYDREILYSRR
jgi:hypothetical protein